MDMSEQGEPDGIDAAPSPKWVATVAFVVLWLFALVTAYFWAHKPFDFALVAGLGRSLLAIAGWIGLVGLAMALGQRLAAQVLAQEEAAVRLSLQAGLGLGLLSLLTLALGVAGLLNPVAAWILVVALAFWLRRQWGQLAAAARSVAWPRPQNLFQRWLLIYGAATLLLAFAGALAPESGWDALVYHLTGPRLFIEAGRIDHFLDMPYLGFPQLVEMQFTLGMLLVGDRVASLLHFGYGVMGLILVVALARRSFGSQAAWLTAAVYLSIPILLELMSDAYVDVALLFYVTAAFYVFARWRQNRIEPGATWWLLLLGAFAGFCAGIKYTAVAVPPALALGVTWTSRGEGVSTWLRRMAVLTGATVLVALPWLLENWYTTGNPVYPFFVHDALYWNAWRSDWYDRSGTGLLATAPYRLLTAPLEATVLGTTGSAAYGATIGPFILGALFLLPVVWGQLGAAEKGVAGHLLLFSGVNYGLWLIGLARSGLLLQTRLLLPVFGVAAVLGGATLDRLRCLKRPALAVDWLVRVVISLSLALLLFSALMGFLLSNPLPVAMGLESEEGYLARTLGSYQMALTAINELPPESRVLLLWEPRSYGCRVVCLPDALLDRLLHLTQYGGYDAGEIASQWQAEGVTHVLLNQRGLDFLVDEGFDPITAGDLAVLAELEADHLLLLEQWGSDYKLFELRSLGQTDR